MVRYWYVYVDVAYRPSQPNAGRLPRGRAITEGLAGGGVVFVAEGEVVGT